MQIFFFVFLTLVIWKVTKMKGVVVSCFGFSLQFSWWLLSLLSCSNWPLHILFCELFIDYSSTLFIIIGLFSLYCWIIEFPYIFWIQSLVGYKYREDFLLVRGLSFHFFSGVFWWAKAFNFRPILSIFFMPFVPWEIICMIWDFKDASLFSSKRSIVRSFYVWSIIHLKWLLVYGVR